MRDPNIGIQLRAARRTLDDIVAPAVSDSDAKRQLRAVLHLLGRLERSWDVGHANLAEDNADIREVLHAVFVSLTGKGLTADIGTIVTELAAIGDEEAAVVDGINDAGLARQSSVNRQLRALSERIYLSIRAHEHVPDDVRTVCEASMRDLFKRMNRRDLALAGEGRA